MGTYVVRRFLHGLVVLAIVSFIGFFIFQYLGDPAEAMAGQYATQAQIEQVRVALGLHRPFYIQYATFISNALQGDFGISFVAKVPVMGMILERLPASIELAFMAELIAIFFGVSIGVLVAAYPRFFLSKAAMTGALLGISLPTFLVGIMLIMIFAVWLGVMPPFGRGDPVPLAFGWKTGLLTLDGLKHIIMPAFTLGMLQLALLFRMTRSGMAEALSSDYIRTARAKGLGRGSVLFKHALRNVLIPVITIIGLQFGQLIGFAIVTESIFQWPGAGNLLLISIYETDFPIIATYIMLVAGLVVFLNMLVDITYAFLNPRIRYD